MKELIKKVFSTPIGKYEIVVMKHTIVLIAFLTSSLIWSQKNVRTVSISDLNNSRLPLSDILATDKFTLLSVGGTWCPPCIMQKPFVASLEKQYPQYLKVVYIFARDTAEKVKSNIWFGQCQQCLFFN